MWSAGFKGVDVFLGRHCLGVQFAGQAATWYSGSTAQDLWRDAMTSIQSRKRAAVRIWLSGSVARPFILPALQGLTKHSDALKIAAARAPEETGLEGACRVSVDTWKPGLPSVCVVMEQTVWAALLELAADAGIRLVSIRPWWSAVLCAGDTSAGSLTLLTVDDGESLILLAGEGDQMSVASSHAPAPDVSLRAALVQRVRLAGQAGAGTQRHVRLAEAGAPAVASDKRLREVPFSATWQGTV